MKIVKQTKTVSASRIRASEPLYSKNDRRVARRLTLTGRVQGLGVRPTIFRLANELGLVGCVRNSCHGVEIDVEGPKSIVSQFSEVLPMQLPLGTQLDQLRLEETTLRGYERFEILMESLNGPLSARVPEDLAVCSDCLEEVRDRNNRRYRYSLTSCTLCGPRYSIIRSMPYERAETTMSEFSFCPSCDSEYRGTGDRRFHAQTNSCSDCGPRIWAVDGKHHAVSLDGDALRATTAALSLGKIVALRGVGGYQLLVDATNEDAVARLRKKKHRLSKPLAVLVDSLPAAQKLAYLDIHEQKALCGRANPIVLVRAKSDGGLARSIHPHLNTVGLMLPSTPLHALVARDVGRPLVCTSGNREGEPLEYRIEQAEKNLAGICDLWLHHNRETTRSIDDSVVRVIAERPVSIRLARGLAPLALDLPSTEPILAVGGYQKASTAWSNGVQAVLGPHIGDQETLAARERYLTQIEDCQTLYRFQPRQLAHDMHPDYFSTAWALRQDKTCVAVQHHHAHVIAGMLQHGWLDREVLGVAWDGTGYGTDGTIWGGEFLVATATAFQRYARLRPFRLPGGETAIQQPWRTAVAVLADVFDKWDVSPQWCWKPRNVDVESVQQILECQHFSPTTTSAGRLFDAAAAIVLAIDRSDFDGQAAMRLEAAADGYASGQYEFPLREGDILELDWRPLFAGLIDDLASGSDPGTISMRFHRTLSAAIANVCRRVDLPTVLTGGVFQNRLLTELVVEQLMDWGRPLGLPGVIPPNDGGLAAGQLAFAASSGENHACV